MNFTDGDIERSFYEHAIDDEFKRFPQWIVQQRDELIERQGALLWIDADDPDLLTGIPVSRLSDYQKAAGQALVNYRKAIMTDKIAWSIVAVPSQKWAAKVFPHLPASEQVDALWEAIFKTVRIGEGDAVENWRNHVSQLETRAKILNDKRYAKLHYKAPGTDVTIALPDKQRLDG